MTEVSINETVVFIHGFAAHWTVFLPCSLSLRSAGLRSQHWAYPTLRQPFIESASVFASMLERLDKKGNRFHIVAHSMGTTVTRLALRTVQLKNLGRIVFLAPPIKGVPFARIAPRFLKHWITTMDSMSDGQNGLHAMVDHENPVPTMVIAARCDMLVPLRNTHLPGQSERSELLGTHNSLLFDPRVHKKIIGFLTRNTI